MAEKWSISPRQSQCSCFFPCAALPLTSTLRTVSHRELREGARCTEGWGSSCFPKGCLLCACASPLSCWTLPGEQGSPGLPKLPCRLPAYPAAISAFHVISRIVLRTAGGSGSFPRGCDGFAAGDLWQLVLGKCCERLWVEWLREAINSLCWEAYIASITWIINFAF